MTNDDNAADNDNTADEDYNNPNNDDDDDADFMKALQQRVTQVTDRESKFPIVVLDSMLPRQTLKIEVDNAVFISMIRYLINEQNPVFGMVGTARLTTGQQMPLQNGVQVEIVGTPVVLEKEGLLRVKLRSGKRIRISGELGNNEQGWGEARVRFLNFEQEEAAEDGVELLKSKQLALEFASPNMSMPKGASLVDRWIELARENERHEGQINDLLQDLGERPSADHPSELAMWIGALINPLPGMGVAMEIRPALLMASSSGERVKVALKGLHASIKHMDGSMPLF